MAKWDLREFRARINLQQEFKKKMQGMTLTKLRKFKPGISRFEQLRKNIIQQKKYESRAINSTYGGLNLIKDRMTSMPAYENIVKPFYYAKLYEMVSSGVNKQRARREAYEMVMEKLEKGFDRNEFGY